MTQQEEDLEALIAYRLFGSLRTAGEVVHANHETIRKRSHRAAFCLLLSLPPSSPLRRALEGAIEVIEDAPKVDSRCHDLSVETDEQAANAV